MASGGGLNLRKKAENHLYANKMNAWILLVNGEVRYLSTLQGANANAVPSTGEGVMASTWYMHKCRNPIG